MFHSLTANNEGFQSVSFDKGLNLIIARRDKTSKDTDTCNGLGKTTLMYIIDFCLGAEPDREDSLSTRNLAGWEFRLEATLADNRVIIRRAVDFPNVVHVRRVDGKPITWTKYKDEFDFGGELDYKVEEWREFLGTALFNLEFHLRGPKDPEIYRPEEHELINFFVRKNYLMEVQPVSSFSFRRELSVTYLLGLNWEFLKKLDDLKQLKKDADAIARSANLKIKEMNRKKGALETEVVMLEGQLQLLKARLDAFKVNEQYEADQKTADECTEKISILSNQIHVINRRIAAARDAIAKSQVDIRRITEIYNEAKFNFPEQVIHSLEEAEKFHEDLTSNRAEFLAQDIHALEKQLSELKAEKARFEATKAEKMEILRTTGALQQYTKMHEEYSHMAEDLNRKKTCLEDLRKSDQQKEEIKAVQKESAVDARKDFKRLEAIWSSAEDCFKELAYVLYKAKGSLNIKLLDEGRRYGFSFKPTIPYDRATGIKNIRIFAFDMMLFVQQKTLGRGIDFLVHDSTIFDGADPRQIATALKEADARTQKHGGQYICMMNAQTLDNADFQGIFPISPDSEYIKLTLSDSSPEKSLLGFRYE